MQCPNLRENAAIKINREILQLLFPTSSPQTGSLFCLEETKLWETGPYCLFFFLKVKKCCTWLLQNPRLLYFHIISVQHPASAIALATRPPLHHCPALHPSPSAAASEINQNPAFDARPPSGSRLFSSHVPLLILYFIFFVYFLN